MAAPQSEISFLLLEDDVQGADTRLPGQQQQQPAALRPPPASGGGEAAAGGRARYTRSLLRHTLQLMGVKPRQSDKVAQKVFLILHQRATLPLSEPLSLAARLHSDPGGRTGVSLPRADFDLSLIHISQGIVR